MHIEVRIRYAQPSHGVGLRDVSRCGVGPGVDVVGPTLRPTPAGAAHKRGKLIGRESRKRGLALCFQIARQAATKMGRDQGTPGRTASNDLVPNLKDPANPLPYADPDKHPQVIGAGGG